MKIENVLVLIADGHADMQNDVFRSEGVELGPGALPVLWEFNRASEMGTVVFRKEGEHVLGDIELTKDGIALLRPLVGLSIYPAIFGRIEESHKDPDGTRVISKCCLHSISLGFDNVDPRIPAVSIGLPSEEAVPLLPALIQGEARLPDADLYHPNWTRTTVMSEAMVPHADIAALLEPPVQEGDGNHVNRIWI